MQGGFWTWFDAEAAPKLGEGFSGGRDKTFRKMFEHLDKVKGPVHIVETGCVEDPDNWSGNGCSTILFDRYARSRPGSTVRSVDIIPDKVEAAKQWVNGVTDIRCGDSVDVMRTFVDEGRKIDLLYLDASHFYWNHPVPSAHHHLNELMAAMPMLKPSTLVAVDDSPAIMDSFLCLQVGGKGEMVARYAFSVGADLEFLEYQAGWTNVTATPTTATLEELVLRARSHVENDRMTAANSLYHLVYHLVGLERQPWRSAVRVCGGEACAFFARLAVVKKKLGTAVEWFQEALRYDPKAVDYRLELANCYLNMDMYDAAVVEAKRATAIEPDNARVWQMLGAFEHERNQPQKAIAAFDKAIELAPNDPDAIINRCTIAIDTQDYDRVEEACKKLASTSRAADALHLMGMITYRRDKHEESLDYFDRAIAMGCRDPATVQWHKSHSLESIGRYREANQARAHRKYSRMRPTLALPFKRFQKPLWTGQPAPARIHVHAESGAGDNLCLVRYLPMLIERGYTVAYEAHEGMLDLVHQSMPEVDVMLRATDYPGALGLKDFDYHLPIGEIQNAFDTGIDTVPWNGAYLKADPVLIEKYGRGGNRRIGFCWSSGIRTTETWLKAYGLRKSMHFDTLLPIVQADAEFSAVNLQVGPERAQHGGVLWDPLPENPTWAETAALVEALDLVITVDTGIAHLAGAMGKPVWLMMHPGGSWHWMVERPGATWNEASPWYPSVRIFRQAKPGDWDGVIARVARELAAIVRLAAV
jgi:tetratricopeptide (TPR) repeat protein